MCIHAPTDISMHIHASIYTSICIKTHMYTYKAYAHVCLNIQVCTIMYIHICTCRYVDTAS